MRRLLFGLILASLLVALAGGCRAPVAILRIEADPGVSWKGYYRVEFSNGPGGSGEGMAIAGSGNWETQLPSDQGRLAGFVIDLAKLTEDNGALRVLLIEGEKVLAENEAAAPLQGVGFAWGTLSGSP